MARLRVLLVEDDPLVAAATARMLGRRHDVLVARSVSRGLAELAARTFDAVVSDFELGDGTGDQILARAAELQPAARRVLYTGAADHARARPFAHCVRQKPASLDELDGAVQSGGEAARPRVRSITGAGGL